MSPSTGDSLGMINFYGNNSAAAKTEYANILVMCTDTSSTSGDAYIDIQRRNANSLTSAITITDSINFHANNLIGINTATATNIICPNITATSSPYPKYDTNTFVVKDDTTVSTIPEPIYHGETYVGVNGGLSGTVAYWTSIAPIVGASGNFTNVVANNTGDSFTLKGSTTGSIRWFIIANNASVFS